jgi:hypothetical protein
VRETQRFDRRLVVGMGSLLIFEENQYEGGLTFSFLLNALLGV